MSTIVHFPDLPEKMCTDVWTMEMNLVGKNELIGCKVSHPRILP